MKDSNEKAVYKLKVDCGRQGELEGLFIAKKNHVKILLESGLEIYFGEVLGKHSEIYGILEEKEVIFVSDSQEVIDIIETHELQNGFNPFEYQVINSDREDFEGLDVLEVVEILEKESL